jgi:hypothetical protein
MKKIISIIFSVFLLGGTLRAQKTIEEVNYLLDTQTYFGFRIDYESNLTLPDSVKQKLLIALSGKLTPHLQDSLLALTPKQKEIFLEQSKQKCEGDSICVKQTYQKIVEETNQQNNYFFINQPVSGELILSAGNWNIKEAIPLLENAMENERYGQQAILMALAKLDNDSAKQILMEKYTLSYILKNTPIDTINDKNLLTYEKWEGAWSIREGMKTAFYLKSKEMMLNILESIYIRGTGILGIGADDYYFPYVSLFINSFSDYNYFHNYSNYQTFRKICDDYRAAIWHLSNRKLNKTEKKELETLLSTEYRTQIKNQIREWIIENVNF